EADSDREGYGKRNGYAQEKNGPPSNGTSGKEPRRHIDRNKPDDFQREGQRHDHLRGRWKRRIDDDTASKQRHAEHPTDQEAVQAVLKPDPEHRQRQGDSTYAG